MNIQEEIKRQQQSAEEKERQRRIQHKQYVSDTRKMIPEIAEYVKTAVARRYLREGGPKGPSVQRRGFIGRKYYRTTINFDTTSTFSSEFWKKQLKWGRALRSCPEVDRELADAITKQGLIFKGISRNDADADQTKVYIFVEFDI